MKAAAIHLATRGVENGVGTTPLSRLSVLRMEKRGDAQAGVVGLGKPTAHNLPRRLQIIERGYRPLAYTDESF
jgi:hypothetical protein